MLKKEAKELQVLETREALDVTSPDRGRRASTVVLHHAAVFVENLDRSASFYADVLGLEVTDRAHLPAIGIEQVFLSAGHKHADLVLARRLNGSVAPPDKRELFHLAFELPREQPFEEFLERVSREGVSVVAGPMERPARFDGSGSRTAAYLRDPDGYLLEVTQEH
ncbi:MAG TPA: VOC family protein [Rubrobacteraceae bacterium]|nr:VOC family protein [Rubrobacteraceae bacterium]